MQAFDYSFSTIKKLESVNNIDDIIDTMKRNHVKKNEVYSKLYELNNQIDVLQGKIDENKEYLMMMMEQSAEMNEFNQENEKTKRMDKKQRKQFIEE